MQEAQGQERKRRNEKERGETEKGGNESREETAILNMIYGFGKGLNRGREQWEGGDSTADSGGSRCRMQIKRRHWRQTDKQHH